MKIDRLISIIMILLEKDRVSAVELAEKFEVSLRTVYRDVEAISMAGIPITATPGVGGGFEILKQYKLEKGVFSADNISLLLTGLTSISGVVRSDELTNAISKISNFIPDENAAQIKFKVNQLAIDFNSWNYNPDISSNLKMIQDALRQNTLLEFEYLTIKGDLHKRNVEPCQLVLKNSQWYLYGFCRYKNDYRLFKLSRISSLKNTGEKFMPKNFPPAKLDYSKEAATLQKEITLKIHNSILERILDFCPMEKIKPLDSNHLVVKFPFIENDFYYDQLLSFGPKCECIKPIAIRKKIKKRLTEMLTLYETD